MASISNAHKRVRFSEATRGHRLPTTDAERAKCPLDHTDVHLCVSTPQDRRIVETLAPNEETTNTAGTDLSFQTAVSSIPDPRTLDTKETNAKVRVRTRKAHNTDSQLASPGPIIEAASTGGRSDQRDPLQKLYDLVVHRPYQDAQSSSRVGHRCGPCLICRSTLRPEWLAQERPPPPT